MDTYVMVWIKLTKVRLKRRLRIGSLCTVYWGPPWGAHNNCTLLYLAPIAQKKFAVGHSILSSPVK